MKTLRIGVTGGIGSGKSTICRIFKLLGIPVFEADREAKRLMNENPELKSQIIEAFGKNIYLENGELNRPRLAHIIFNNAEALSTINNLVHPAVRHEFDRWTRQQNSPYVIQEAAILFESGSYKTMNYTLLVTAPVEMRIKRVMQRDGVSREEVLARIDKQWPDEQKRKLATYEIETNEKELIIPKIIHIDKQLRDYGKIW